MTRLTILNPDGSLAIETEAAAGQSLLSVAQILGLPLEGTCEGAMACSTCHVLVAPADLPKLPAPSAHEEDMLDFTPHVGPTSRLACQIELTAALERLEVKLPPGHANMQGR
ncbi:2Fe-2S iron-sulfur cluster-binding protein [Sandaracinobacter sp. RS1-74]|uniref:2Fe-2S iron-sulfur cluster-binding protein n=1 Tax=Sandaracinobacteroides sayramensis TaxID=2913411 RepID=UPI001EDBAD94|nr:2Fe-2S iron-sulfur cluster-binding protein [Sandaracinobacteroides sayramensis]MCG2839386.1 2Fe-2S iron-sulfur cluster-binding protein [Sandaracinobacteroides sayramensis]